MSCANVAPLDKCFKIGERQRLRSLRTEQRRVQVAC